ncbi:hypothetical protein glysoja_008891 [Glycine soja]|nr:hypothetical protein glysoja_008891 [Glycine soja]
MKLTFSKSQQQPRFFFGKLNVYRGARTISVISFQKGVTAKGSSVAQMIKQVISKDLQFVIG